MKTLLVLLLILALPLAGSAEGAVLPAWLELSGENRVMTVWLPWSADDGCSWSFESSDPAVLDLLTMEILGDEPGETESLWVASFLCTADGEHEAKLTLRYGKDGPAPEEIRTVDVKTDAVGAMILEKVQVFPSAESWYGIDLMRNQLSVCLPSNPSTGYGWSAEISAPERLMQLSEEYVSDATDSIAAGAGGTWMASFGWPEGQTGEVTLTLCYARLWESIPLEMRVLELFIDADGNASILSVESKK